jgi:hypothetical protein
MGPPVLPEVDVMPLVLLVLPLVELAPEDIIPEDVIPEEPELVLDDGSPPELDVVISPLDDEALGSVDEPGN